MNEQKYLYLCEIFAIVDGKEEYLTLPMDLDQFDEVNFIWLEHSNFPINLLSVDDIDARALNDLLIKINDCTEFQQDVIFALFYTSRNRTFKDLLRAYHFRDDFDRVPRYGVSNAELNAAEFLFYAMCAEDAEHFEDDAFFLALFYMAVRSRDIIPFEEYYYIRTNNLNRIYSKEDVRFVQQLISESEDYRYE